MITLKSEREIEMMRKSGAVLAGVHLGLRNIIKPGISSWDIEKFANAYIEEHHAKAEEKGFEGYKYATCVSVNDEVAHAIPRKNLLLKNGDIVAVDMVVNLDGFMSDSCWTYAVGTISKEKQHLMDVTKKAYTSVSTKPLLVTGSVILVTPFNTTLKTKTTWAMFVN